MYAYQTSSGNWKNVNQALEINLLQPYLNLMALPKTLNAKTLESLGAKRLAELFIELSKNSPPLKRRLKMALAREQADGSLKKQIQLKARVIDPVSKLAISTLRSEAYFGRI